MSDSPSEVHPPRPGPIAGGDLLLTDRAALDQLEDTWRRLWSVTAPAPPMLEYRWVREWWRLQRSAGRLFIVLVLDDQQRPLGLAPLYLRDEGLRHPARCLRTVGFLGTGEPERDEVVGEYTGWLARPEVLPQVTERVRARLQAAAGRWDRLLLERMWPGGAVDERLADGLRDLTLRSQVTHMPSFRAPVRPLTRYVTELPSANFRSRCRRAIRAGEQAGVTFVRAADDGAVAQMFAALESLHQRRWHQRGEPGVFASPVFSAFQKAVLPAYVAGGRAWLVGLRQGDQWLAVRYLLRAGNRLYDYVSGVDTENHTPNLAPGLLLHLHTIDACAAEGIEVYDLMAGDADYKRHLAREETALPTLDLFARTMRSRLWLAARDLRRRVRARNPQPPTATAESAPGTNADQATGG